MIDYTYVELTSACTTALAEFRKQVCPPCTSCVHHVTCSMLNLASTNPNPNPNPIWFSSPTIAPRRCAAPSREACALSLLCSAMMAPGERAGGAVQLCSCSCGRDGLHSHDCAVGYGQVWKLGHLLHVWHLVWCGGSDGRRRHARVGAH